MKHDNNLAWFDFFRGMAALLVLTGHLRALIFLDFSHSTSIFYNVFYFVTGFAHEAVIIFFVLSGFFIIRSIHESVLRRKWDPKDYAINRLSRLWIVLLPSLLMTLALDKIGMAYYRNSFIYTGTVKTMQAVNPSHSLGFTDFIGNLFFLQSIKVPTFGSNSALWSLANEFWYYLIFPAAYFTFVKYYKPVTRILLFLFFVGCSFFAGMNICSYFIIWLMGGVAYVIIKNNLFLKNRIIIKVILSTLAFVAVLGFIRFKIHPEIFNDFSLGVITLVMICAFSRLPMQNVYLKKTTEFFSNISYSVYLMHLSFAVLIVTIFFDQRVAFGVLSFCSFLLIMLAILSYSFLFYYLFERNTPVFKNFIRKIFK